MKIEIKDVTKKINDNIVLREIDVTFEGAKVYGLYGKNGSGKTMLMRLAAGLMRPTTGEVLVNGKKLGVNSDYPTSMGFLIENPSFIDSYSGLVNLELIAGLRNVISREQIEATIARVGLDPHDKKKFKKYSLGMKQRLGIAAAIMEKPELIILDEPINALDDSGVELLGDIIRAERERGAMIILACHDYDFLSSVSDEILYVRDGEIRGRM